MIEVAVESEIGRLAAIDIFQWLLKVCSTKLIQSLVILVKLYRVDESLFRHKPKVMN